jgi:hypothetical protein
MQKLVASILDYTNLLEERIKRLEQENVETTNILYELQNTLEQLQYETRLSESN